MNVVDEYENLPNWLRNHVIGLETLREVDYPLWCKIKHFTRLMDKYVKNVETALDAGCGFGIVSKYLSDTYPAAVFVGLDISKERLTTAQKWTTAIFCDLEKGIPLSDSSIDLCICADIIEHIRNVDLLMTEIVRILRRGGFLLVSIPNLSSFFDRMALLLGYQPFSLEVSAKGRFGDIRGHKQEDLIQVGHCTALTKKALMDMLSFYGFKILEVRGIPFHRGRALLVSAMDVLCSKIPSLSSELAVMACKRNSQS